MAGLVVLAVDFDGASLSNPGAAVGEGGASVPEVRHIPFEARSGDLTDAFLVLLSFDRVSESPASFPALVVETRLTWRF